MSSNHSAPHSALLRTCEDYLRARGAWTLRIAGGLGQRRGSPDLLAGLGGRLIAIEGKTGKAVLSVAQKAERERIVAAGGLFVEARSVDDVEDALLAAGVVERAVLWPRREG